MSKKQIIIIVASTLLSLGVIIFAIKQGMSFQEFIALVIGLSGILGIIVIAFSQEIKPEIMGGS